MQVISKRKRKCKECTKIYTVSKDWQIFCGASCRSRFNKNRYCFFCGIPADSKHHILPRVISKKGFKDTEYVFTCNECNSTLCDHIFLYVHEEAQYLIDKYTRKYGLQTKRVEWDDEEIDELSGMLKQMVKKSISRKIIAEERVYYLRGVRNRLICEEQEIEYDDI